MEIASAELTHSRPRALRTGLRAPRPISSSLSARRRRALFPRCSRAPRASASPLPLRGRTRRVTRRCVRDGSETGQRHTRASDRRGDHDVGEARRATAPTEPSPPVVPALCARLAFHRFEAASSAWLGAVTTVRDDPRPSGVGRRPTRATSPGKGAQLGAACPVRLAGLPLARRRAAGAQGTSRDVGGQWARRPLVVHTGAPLPHPSLPWARL